MGIGVNDHEDSRLLIVDVGDVELDCASRRAMRVVELVVDADGAYLFFFSSRRRHTRLQGDWSSDVCSSDLEVLAQLQQKPAKMILRAAYNDGRSAEWLAERTKLPIVVLPFTVGGSEKARD